MKESGKIVSYFKDFDDKNMELKRENGIICIDPSQTSLEGQRGEVLIYRLKGVPIFVKDFYAEIGEENAVIYEAVVSKVMNDCGVNSAPYFYSLKKDKENEYSKLCAFSQSVFDVDGITAFGGDEFVKFVVGTWLEDYKPDDFWYFVENPKVKPIFLQHMTEECFEQLVDLCLFDELAGIVDRHFRNYYFYKLNPESKKFDGIINIDSAMTWIFSSKGYRKNAQIDFDCNFSYFTYKSFLKITAVGEFSEYSYEESIKRIKKLFNKGVFGERQARLVKNFIESDIASQLKSGAEKTNRTMSKAVIDLYERVNEYLDQNLQRQL